MQPRLYYTLIGVVAILIWGFEESLMMSLKNLPQFETLSLIFLFSFISSALYTLQKRRIAYLVTHPPYIWVSYLLRFGFYELALLIAARSIPSEQADSIDSLGPVFAVIGGFIFLKDKNFLKNAIAVLFSFYGVLILMGGTPSYQISHQTFGYISALMGALFLGQYIVASRRYGKESIEVIACVYGLFYVFCWLASMVFEKWVWPSSTQWLMLLGLGVFINFVSDAFWDFAMKKGHGKFLNIFSYFGSVISISILIFFGFSHPSERLFEAALFITLGSLISILNFSWIVSLVRPKN